MSERREPDDGSLAARIARSLPELAAYVRARLGPELARRESASDIVQSTARELLRAPAFDDRGERSFQRWLRVAAEHKIRNRARYWRSAGRGERHEGPTTELERADGRARRPSEDAALSEQRERLIGALGELPAEYREVLERVQLDGRSYAEVAAELGRSSEAVRKLAARGLAQLTTRLRECE